MIQGQLCGAVTDQYDALTVAVPRKIIKKTAHALNNVPQAFAFWEWRLSAHWSLGVYLLNRRTGHRPIVVLAES